MNMISRRDSLKAGLAAIAATATVGVSPETNAQPAAKALFTVEPTFIPIANTAISGASHLLHRSQLRCACTRDGL